MSNYQKMHGFQNICATICSDDHIEIPDAGKFHSTKISFSLYKVHSVCAQLFGFQTFELVPDRYIPYIPD